MFGTVIVPLDGSAHAEAAIPYARDEATRHGAALVLVQVVYRPEPCVPRSGPPPPQFPWPTRDSERRIEQATRYLADAIERFGLGPSTKGLVLVGEPVPRILAEASRHDRPVIVLTTGDPSATDKPPVSEIARRLMLNGTIPVLAVRSPRRPIVVARSPIPRACPPSARRPG
jgi:nucleotide-binding universal stress UspA family protein